LAVVNTECPVISFTSDFGLDDNYVSIVKGIIAGINPEINIVDISHRLPPYNINAARYLLETSYGHFPPGTVHLAVIDPGVGSSRKAIIIETEEYFFVGPDNGLFSFLDKKDIKNLIGITNKKYLLGKPSSTFHGRDIFAPAAAWLSRGIAPEEFGPKLDNIVRARRKPVEKTKEGIKGFLTYIDHFGNLVSSIKEFDLPSAKGTIYLDEHKIGALRKTFSSVKKGKPVAYTNSFGYLEIAVNKGSAAEFFSVDYTSDIQILFASR